MDLQEVDACINNELRIGHGHLMFEMRDKLGVFPYRVRTTVYVMVDGVSHLCEVEMGVDHNNSEILEILEAQYSRAVAKMTIDEAKKLIDELEKDKGEDNEISK